MRPPRAACWASFAALPAAATAVAVTCPAPRPRALSGNWYNASGWDYFHPNASGQAVLASVSYAAGLSR